MSYTDVFGDETNFPSFGTLLTVICQSTDGVEHAKLYFDNRVGPGVDTFAPMPYTTSQVLSYQQIKYFIVLDGVTKVGARFCCSASADPNTPKDCVWGDHYITCE